LKGEDKHGKNERKRAEKRNLQENLKSKGAKQKPKKFGEE
jgi:hypothetical protein